MFSRMFHVSGVECCLPVGSFWYWTMVSRVDTLFSVIAWSQGSYSSAPASSAIVSPAFSWEMF